MVAGALAQLGERLICIQEVIGSIPIGSTSSLENAILNSTQHHQAHLRMRLIVLCGRIDIV